MTVYINHTNKTYPHAVLSAVIRRGIERGDPAIVEVPAPHVKAAETFPRPKGPTPTIYQIKAAQPASSRFFSRENMRFAGQTLKSFSVSWNADVGAWESVAARYDRDGKYMGNSVHCWQVGTLKHLGSLDACLRTVATECVNKKD